MQRSTLAQKNVRIDALIAPLVLYALRDARFADFLARRSQGGGDASAITIRESSVLLVPSDLRTAIARYHWLARTYPEAAARTAVLADAIRTSEDPKAIVIGFVIGVVPPVGMGDIPKKKKLNVVIREEYAKGASPSLLARTITKATSGLLLSAAKRNKGSLDRVEPDLHEWLYGERELALYTGDGQELAALDATLRDPGILAFSLSDEKGTLSIAISPSADLATHVERLGLTPLEER